MSEEMQVEGEKAKRERQAKEAVHKLIDGLTVDHQMIIIVKDMSGKTPFHIHCAGPLADPELLSGMCMTAVVTIQSQKSKQENLN